VFYRFRRWLHELLVAIDQLLHVVFGGPKYVLVGGEVPNADETISSKVGRASLQGKRWARWFAEPAIDAVMFVLTGQKNHCIASIGR
jgi:hypothetical protein